MKTRFISFVFSILFSLGVFLSLGSFSKTSAQEYISYGFYIQTSDFRMYPLEKVRVLFFGRVNAFQGWRYISSTLTNSDGEANVSVSKTRYNDFALTVIGPQGWVSTGGHLLGTPPHADCQRVSLSRWQCLNARQKIIRSVPFRFIFKQNYPPLDKNYSLLSTKRVTINKY
jgi:hypothetical protein